MKPRLSLFRRMAYDAIVRHFLERSGAASPAADVAGTPLPVVIDPRQAHLTETQLLAKARDFYAKIASRETTHSPTVRTGSNR